MRISAVVAGWQRSPLGGARAVVCTANARAARRVLTERELEPFGDPARLCLSINTPEELAAAGG